MRERLATSFYKKVILSSTAPFSEKTHNVVLLALRRLQKSEVLEVLREELQVDDERLKVNVLGLEFPNPFILAAGMDKDGIVIPAFTTFGLGGIEAGSFTLQGREGNPQIREETQPDGRRIKVKRMKRFSDGTVINWMGFPGVGTKKGVENLKGGMKGARVPVGVNIAATPELESEEEKINDITQSLELVYPLKPSWMTLNISCPNVEDVKGRRQKMEEGLLMVDVFAVKSRSLEEELDFRIPALVKIGPDMNPEEIWTLVRQTKELGYDGIVATNTTVDRTGPRRKFAHIKKGGLSGPLLFEKSLQTVRVVKEFDQRLPGKPLVIMGCGGVDSAGRWLQMREAGADLCQILTGFVFGGPYFFKKLNREYLQSLNCG